MEGIAGYWVHGLVGKRSQNDKNECKQRCTSFVDVCPTRRDRVRNRDIRLGIFNRRKFARASFAVVWSCVV